MISQIKSCLLAFAVVLLLATFLGYHQGLIAQNPFIYSHAAAHFQKIDKNSSVPTLECSIPDGKGNLCFSRQSKVGFSYCKNFNINFQANQFSSSQGHKFHALATSQQHSHEFLNLSILRSKHHPPTNI